MPTLQIFGDDLHYAIKVSRGGIQTWQVTDTGIQFLRNKGIDIPQSPGDVSEFDRSLFEKMLTLDLVYTKNKSRGTVDEGGTLEELSQRHFALTVRERGPLGWQLAIQPLTIPEQQPKRAVQPCFFRVYDPNTFYRQSQRLLCMWMLSDLLSGRSCTVEPISGMYYLEAKGPWLDAYLVRLGSGNHRIPALYADGTLFSDEAHHSLRLAPGEVIYPGRIYYFVARQGTKLLPELPHSSLGILQSTSGQAGVKAWQAWKITIPHITDKQTYEKISAWCEQIGHPFRELPWRLTLISPPPLDYTSNGHPILERGCNVLIEALPPTNSVQGAESIEICVKRDGKSYMPPSSPISTQRLMAFLLDQTGDYHIDALNGFARPVVLRVKSSDQHLPDTPEALSMHIRANEQQFTYSAYDQIGQSQQEQVIELAQFGDGPSPTCTVHCPVPVDITWSCGQEHRQQWSHIKASNVEEYINSLLTFAWKRQEELSLFIEAGAFGRLSLRICEHVVRPKDAVAESPDRLLSYMQWLNDVVNANAQSVDVTWVPIPTMIRARLEPFANQPKYAPLRALTHIPYTLLPHLATFTKLLLSEESTFSAY